MPRAPPPPTPTLRHAYNFDPYNASTTGHQRADNRLAGSTAWRTSRTRKLGQQLSAGVRGGGGERVGDGVGAGSANFGRDGRTPSGSWDESVRGARGRTGVRGEGDLAVWIREGRWVAGNGTAGEDEGRGEEEEAIVRWQREKEEERWRAEEDFDAACGSTTPAGNGQAASTALTTAVNDPGRSKDTTRLAPMSEFSPPPPRKIFAGLTIYINGSTAPLVSDHRLKYLLAEHGAAVNLALGRRRVTHVVLGRPSGRGVGAGGGLAAGKLEKEVTRLGGIGVKFVGVEW